jgi:hypothetical protein
MRYFLFIFFVLLFTLPAFSYSDLDVAVASRRFFVLEGTQYVYHRSSSITYYLYSGSKIEAYSSSYRIHYRYLRLDGARTVIDAYLTVSSSNVKLSSSGTILYFVYDGLLFESSGKLTDLESLRNKSYWSPVYNDGELVGFWCEIGGFMRVDGVFMSDMPSEYSVPSLSSTYTIYGNPSNLHPMYSAVIGGLVVGYIDDVNSRYYDLDFKPSSLSGLSSNYDYFQPVIDGSNNLLGFVGRDGVWRDEFGDVISAPNGYENYVFNSDLSSYQPVYDGAGNVVGWGNSSGSLIRNSRPYRNSNPSNPDIGNPTNPSTPDTSNPTNPDSSNNDVPPLPSLLPGSSIGDFVGMPSIPYNTWSVEGVYFKRASSGKLVFDSPVFFGEFKDKFISKFGLIDLVNKLKLGDTTIEPFYFEYVYPAISGMSGKSFSFTFDLNSVLSKVPSSLIFLVRTILVFVVYFEFLVLSVKIFS